MYNFSAFGLDWKVEEKEREREREEDTGRHGADSQAVRSARFQSAEN